MTTDDKPLGPCPLCGGEARIENGYASCPVCLLRCAWDVWTKLSALAEQNKRRGEVSTFVYGEDLLAVVRKHVDIPDFTRKVTIVMEYDKPVEITCEYQGRPPDDQRGGRVSRD